MRPRRWRSCCARPAGEVDTLARAERGDHVRARFAGTGPAVLLLGHFDTVWPVGTLERMPLRRDGDRLHGPGVFDMKAGIALAIAAITALRATGTPHPSVTMLWTTDEEIGSDTSRADIEAEARESRAVLVLEPSLPGGALKTARKGCGDFELTVHGIAAHAGLDPGKGASAIHELAAQIAEIERLQDLPARDQRQRRDRLRRDAGQRRRRGSARDHRRPRADARRGGRRRVGAPRAATAPAGHASY